MDELKPCPFCGGAAHFDHDDDGWNWIECAGCGASTNARVSAMDDCKPLLAEQWNSRVTPGVPAVAPVHPCGRAHLLDLFDDYASATDDGYWKDDSKRAALAIIEALQDELKEHGAAGVDTSRGTCRKGFRTRPCGGCSDGCADAGVDTSAEPKEGDHA